MRHCSGCPCLVLEFSTQDLSLTCMVGWADDPFLLHTLHDGSRPVVTDLQPALVEATHTGKVIAWIGTAMYAAFALGAPIDSALYASYRFLAIALATTFRMEHVSDEQYQR